MGILDKSATQEEFNEFKKKTSKKINLLEKEINNKVSHNEKWIKNKVEKIDEIYENVKHNESNIENGLNEVNTYVSDSRGILEQLKSTIKDLDVIIKEVKQQQKIVLSKKDEITNASSDVNEKIQIINDALNTAETLPENIENIKKIVKTSKDIGEDIEALKKHSMDKKSNIDELYNELYGQDIEDEHIDGIKDSLKKTYDDLKKEIETLDDELSESIKESSGEFDELLKNSKNSYDEINNQLKTLLPGAMASGLSSAYSQKIEDEKESKHSLEGSFKWSLAGLVMVSLLPVGLNIYRLAFTGDTLTQVIEATPSLLMFVLPIYLPILWSAYSSSKKLNLSKRLIEEYTHKAVLGKTFEGLSTQIETLSVSDSIREELRTKLLFNLLQVSSENPGKLITDYQTADHPIMEALENSSNLSNSIDKLNKIPGFSAIAKKLSIQQEAILNKTEKDVKSGLNAQDAIKKNTKNEKTS